MQAKAETLCHYSYCRFGKHAMVLDIQGCGYSITDPEVATMQPTDALFYGGNLRPKAITDPENNILVNWQNYMAHC